MSFKEAIAHVFSNYANFSGRARRSEYWYFILFSALVNFVIGILQNMTKESSMGSFLGIVGGLITLALLIPGLAVAWRRFHDIGKSGAWYLLNLIPIIGSIIVIVMLCGDSQPGPNQYGENPKEVVDVI